MRRRHVINLCFHGIGVPQRELGSGEAEHWVTEQLFTQTLDQAMDRADVSISFDDGNASDVTIALPALHERGLRASFFPLAGRIGEPGSVDRAGLRELVRSGMTVGTHGMRHVGWAGLTDTDAHEELVVARDVISAEAGVPVSAAACPFGSYDRRSLRRLRQLNYAQVLTSDRAIARRGSWFQPRFSIMGGDDRASVKRLLDQPVSFPSRLPSSVRVAVKQCR